MTTLNKKRRSKTIRTVIKYAVITVSGILLFIMMNRAANAERIADSIGGEGLFLFLPVMWWLTERTIKDLVGEWKRMWREAKTESTATQSTEEAKCKIHEEVLR